MISIVGKIYKLSPFSSIFLFILGTFFQEIQIKTVVEIEL